MASYRRRKRELMIWARYRGRVGYWDRCVQLPKGHIRAEGRLIGTRRRGYFRYPDGVEIWW